MDQEKLNKASKLSEELQEIKRDIKTLEELRDEITLKIIVTPVESVLRSKQVELNDTGFSKKIKDEVLSFFKTREEELTKEFKEL